MAKKKPKPSKEIADFLNFVDQCKAEHQFAYESVGDFDNLQQDLLHEIEFAKNQADRNKIATRMQRMRVERRENKDKVKELNDIVIFFNESGHKKTINNMRQLLGKQRKTEEYLDGGRTYTPRKGAET